MTLKPDIRLAFRVEGHMWNAYAAESDTMEGAQLIGSICMAGVRNNPGRKQLFMLMMREVMNEGLRAVVGTEADWGDPQPAPEHERSGTA